MNVEQRIKVSTKKCRMCSDLTNFVVTFERAGIEISIPTCKNCSENFGFLFYDIINKSISLFDESIKLKKKLKLINAKEKL